VGQTAIGGRVPRRRLLIYSQLSESRTFYRPRHAAPSLLLRLERRLSLILVRAHQLVGYYPPPRHRRRPAVIQPQWPRLGNAAVAASRGTGPYPAFVASPVFVASRARVAIRHG
jgi:hypothetical protein